MTAYVDTRELLGITQGELASLIGCHPLTVSKWERGTNSPSAYQEAMLEAFAHAGRLDRTVGRRAMVILSTNGVSAAVYAILRVAHGVS